MPGTRGRSSLSTWTGQTIRILKYEKDSAPRGAQKPPGTHSADGKLRLRLPSARAGRGPTQARSRRTRCSGTIHACVNPEHLLWRDTLGGAGQTTLISKHETLQWPWVPGSRLHGSQATQRRSVELRARAWRPRSSARARGKTHSSGAYLGHVHEGAHQHGRQARTEREPPRQGARHGGSHGSSEKKSTDIRHGHVAVPTKCSWDGGSLKSGRKEGDCR
jgi:hypothetical protein